MAFMKCVDGREVDPSTLLVRYMPLQRFRELKRSRSLYFRRSTDFGDQEEGQALSRGVEKYLNNAPALAADFEKSTRSHREKIYISCWTQSRDNARIWRDYADDGRGVAIVTTFQLLRSVLERGEHDLEFAKVQYCDFDSPPFPIMDEVGANLTKKQLAFEWEREVRILFRDYGASRPRQVDSRGSLSRL